MQKIWFWFFIIVLILAISLLMLNAFANAKLKQFYNDYYQTACSEQVYNLPCSQTEGCYTDCGSACPPEQKISILKTFDFFKQKGCDNVCIPQCVCKYDYEFNEETGCTKR